ncbi:MAG: nitroreductase family protein [Frankia sp.]
MPGPLRAGSFATVELSEVMRTSGAARAFTDEPVARETLYRILDNARFAPSGGNQQPWVVLVVEDSARRRRIRDLAQLGWREYKAHVAAGLRPVGAGPARGGARPRGDPAPGRPTPPPLGVIAGLNEVPVLLVVAARLTALAVMDADLDRQSIVGGGSIYPFVQNILLAARDEGLGGTMTTFIARQHAEAAALLGIPPDHAIAAMVALGRPAKQVTRLRRDPVEQFTHIDTWAGPALRPTT